MKIKLSIKKVHIFISGRVQGVSYRWWFQNESRKRNLRGWVRNMKSNKVEAEIEGEKKQVDEMIKISKKGPALADVENITIDLINSLSNVDSNIKEVKILESI